MIQCYGNWFTAIKAASLIVMSIDISVKRDLLLSEQQIVIITNIIIAVITNN